ncbi:MAG: ABC transporter substrate-binding protein [Rhodobacter sp.]|jgi:phospholipid transport system substrate-binding protein|nr:ABC transporter substrate-binding protein [Rhodobacter sp.]
MANELSRRHVLGLGVAGGVAICLPRAAWALDVDQARGLIDDVVNEINRVISSGGSEAAMLTQFEALFARYADVPVIARSVLGPAGRQASPAQIAGFTQAFQGYISRRYGRRFREFIGGRIEVVDARPVKSYYEVITTAILQGESPFEVRFQVSDKSGKLLFFNIIIEGVNMLASARTEIGAMLDRQGGNLDALIAELQTT